MFCKVSRTPIIATYLGITPDGRIRIDRASRLRLLSIQVFAGHVVLGHRMGANFPRYAFSGVFDAQYTSASNALPSSIDVCT
jgi:hypothetical protein